MIIRIATGLVSPGREEEFARLVREQGMPALLGQDGLVDAWFGRRQLDDRLEYTLVTVWRDWDALRAWTRGDVESHVYFGHEPELLDESSIRLYEGLEAPPAQT